ncbi:MAG TPA: apolipoprotein N-acyltransferase, partial [Bacteroidia bacterium]|nr:apolipoprotein N-acyltransferase [Bacteroidia bacterium]
IVISLLLFYTYKEIGTPVEVIVVQPNIDPYNEKFAGSSNAIPYPQQFARLLSLSESKRTANTRFILWPETALPANLNEDELIEDPLVKKLQQYAVKNNVSILTGIDSYRFMNEQHKTITASKADTKNIYYDVYNAALLVNPDYTLGIYHKSRLVPGVESLPYPQIFGFVTESLGGIVQPVGVDSVPKTLFNPSKVGVAPVICYESIFGEYVSGYSQRGADFIGIITNDGWWGNTPGHIQHFEYARLRAVEQRKSVARAANTGISGFINQRGEILQKNAYWIRDVLKESIKANNTLTFYAKHGDYIGFYALILSPFLFIGSFFIKRYV